ncbi:MAG: ketopantoate reductase family protein [Hylemonella sp.]|uniref:ketopantoate reductase family protein n=1 Tax=Hylemonella sp. TaxID=2066020 RepID=UPI003919E915
MHHPRRILILGASYGSLLGIKLVMAGHRVTLVCLPNEVALINREGIRVRLPLKGRADLVELSSLQSPGRLDAAGPAEVIPADYDLVALAMQEPQYRSPGVRDLLQAVAKSRVPCMSIMNMPPLPYLARLPGVDAAACRGAYTDPAVWDGFDPATMTLCSPDPQAFRPPEEALNVLQVRLPTNFKVASFPSAAHTELLRGLQADIEAIRHTVDGQTVELAVKLKVHDSVFVPLAKWAMLLAGNYRCVTAQGVRAIRDAVHADLQASREVYDWVCMLCRTLGAAQADLVPFDKYAAAAQGLASPSSAARALYGGALHIERVDRLVQAIAAQRGLRHPAVDEVVALVDAQLERNRAAKN